MLNNNLPKDKFQKQSLLCQAQQLRSQGQINKSIQKYKEHFTNNPKFISALQQLAEEHNQRQNFGKAIACYKRILEIQKDNQAACEGLGSLLKKLSSLNLKTKFEEKQLDWKIAIQAFEKTIEFYPKIAAEAIGIKKEQEIEHVRKEIYIYLAKLLLRYCEEMDLAKTYLEQVHYHHTNKEEIYHNIWEGLNSINVLNSSNLPAENELNVAQVQSVFQEQDSPTQVDLAKRTNKEEEILTKSNLRLKILESSLTKYGNSNTHRSAFNFIDELNQTGTNVVNFGYIYTLCPFTGKILYSQVSFPIGNVIFYRFVSQEVFYLILNRNNPGRNKFLYFPKCELIVGDRIRKPCEHLIKEFKSYMVCCWQNVMHYIENKDRKSLLAITGTSDHLGHTLLNQLSAYQNLYDWNLLNKINNFFIGPFDRWNFRKLFPEVSSACILARNHQSNFDVFKIVVERNYFAFTPLQSHTIQQKLADRINSAAFQDCSQTVFEKVEAAKQHFPLIWFEVRSRNRRTWLSQIEGIVNIVRSLYHDYPHLGIVLAGWTRLENNPTGADQKNIKWDRETIDKIISQLPKEIHTYSVVGCTVQEKVVWCNIIDLYVCGFGTGANFHGIAKKPGIIHTNRSLHGWAQEHFQNCIENGIVPVETPLDCIVDEKPEERPANRNYDINWRVIYQEIVNIIEKLPRERR